MIKRITALLLSALLLIPMLCITPNAEDENKFIFVNGEKAAYAENPLPETTDKKRGRKKKGKVLNLIGRLDKYKAAVCLFIKDFRVPFDNNQAERDIRMIKVKTKVSGCFRSVEGAQEYLTIMSYIGTARKHGINPYEAIRSAISGNPDIIFN